MTASEPSTSGFASFAPLVRDRARSGLFVDFDGTLSDIVDDPAAARPHAGAVDALASLAAVFGRVGVVSGRPIDFLAPFFGDAIALAGLYGLETRVDGVVHHHPLASSWREAVQDVATYSVARGPAGMRVESKGLSLTLHFRGAPQIEHDVRAWAQKQAARSGLVLRGARMSYELHPPIEADKGTTVIELADGLTAVAYIGDDLGDLPAFDGLDVLSTRGVDTVRAAVRSAELSPRIVERADVLLDGPAAVVDVLTRLASTAP